jgi:putative endonuclease
MKSNQSTRSKGSDGENKAETYIIGLGYKIIKRNFIFGKIGEIDIIAQEGNCLVFFEVKYSTSDTFGDPLYWKTPKKQRNLRKVAEAYLYVNNIKDVECRFDIIVLDSSNSEEAQLTHIKSAF